MDRDLLKQRLVEYGMDLGFGIVRFTDTRPLKLWDAQIEIRKEKDPDSTSLWRNMKFDPRDIMPEAKTIIVAIWPHIPYKAKLPKGIGRFSAYYKAYPKGRDGIERLSCFLQNAGYKSIAEPNLPAKELALKSGAGYFGNNSLIHAKEFGSWISIHYILTDADISSDPSMDKISDCDDCDLCIKACPTGAIEAKGQVTPSKCIRYYMLSSDFIPENIRDKMGDKMIGCDICQVVCPFNKKAITKASPAPSYETELFNIEAILKEWPKGQKWRMDALANLIGRNYGRSQKILSSAIIVAGNSGDELYLPALEGLLSHPHPPIRGHSAWAIGKICSSLSSPLYREVLDRAFMKENDTKVLDEIQKALKVMESNLQCH